MSLAREKFKSSLRIVGKPLPRIDARGKVAGEIRYSGDYFEKDLLYGKTLRSPHTHAEIVRLDTSKAEALDGVRAVITYLDAPETPFEEGEEGPAGSVAPVYVLNRVIRHVGDEIAAVAADSEEIAEEALGLIEVEYKSLPFVLDPEEALEPDAPLVRGGSNVAGCEPIAYGRGDVEKGLADADLVIEETYRTQATSPLSLEPRYCLARWDGDHLTLWKSSRNVYGDRHRLAKVFGLTHDQVRVTAACSGAGFGSKDETRLACLTAMLARKAGRPVRMGYTREEEMAFGRWRHPTIIRLKMGFKRDGSVTAVDSLGILNTGPYNPSFTEGSRLGHGITYLYTCPNARYVGKVVFTNIPVAGAYRGLGAPQGHFALESLIDSAAERLRIDPLEFRRRHHVRPEGQPGAPYVPKDKDVSSQPIEGGIPFSSNYLAECLDEGARRIGWKPRPNGPRKLKIDGKCRGMGVACVVYRTGQSNASAVVRVKSDGTAELMMASMDVGQGAWTILTQIAAEALGLRYAEVKGTFADTQLTPFAHATSGSTTTFTSGLAAERAAEDARRKVLETAARLLEVKVDDLDIRDGVVFERNTPAHHLPIGKVASRAAGHEIVGQANVRAGSKTHIVNSFGAHFAEVEVDPEDGMVRVLRYVAVHDSGRIINPETAQGQVEGGVIQGLGWTLMEEIPFDPESGAPMAHNLHDFKIPTTADLPKIQVVMLDHVDPVGPYGAKALGEPTQVPVAAAIANAVYDATAVRIRDLPITAEKVLAGLAKGKF